MPLDNAPAFSANPTAFIALHPIVLNQIAQSMPGGLGFPRVNNQRSRFTLSSGPAGGPPGPNDLPCLRMQPAAVGVGAVVQQPADQPALTTLDAWYCHAGDGGMPFNNQPFCDIPTAPGAADAHFLFTTGMNGCTLVLASAVGPGAPALAPGHWRVMHDHDHRPLQSWAAAGCTLHFATYADAAGAGPVPAAWPPPIVRNYDPHSYGFVPPPPAPNGIRVVTNFLWWDGAHWNFGSRHFHTAGAVATAVDAPPGRVPAQPSTQTCQL